MGKIRDYIENSREVYTESVAVDIDVEPKSTTPINMSAMLQGTISLSNTIQSIGFNTTLHTGNGTTQDIVTGVDMKSNWDDYSGIATWSAGTYNTDDEVTITDTSGRLLRCVCLQDGVTSDPNTLLDFTDATFSDWKIESKTFGGRVWIKNRDIASSHAIYDTIRGSQYKLASNSTSSEDFNDLVNDDLEAFNINGFSISKGTDSTYNELNGDTKNYASWTDQTTFIESFLTSHNKPAIRETNVITGYVQIKYKGSGLAGHEIEHGMGRELGLGVIKRLSATSSWRVFADVFDATQQILTLQTTAGLANDTSMFNTFSDNSLTLKTNVDVNTANDTYILYGHTNAYIDENDNLQGNYEIGTYQGTGIAGNKVTTKGEPAYVMIKRIDSTSGWYIFDNKRNIDGEYLFADDSVIEIDSSILTINSMGFTVSGSASSGINASGGQYLYIVIYDNDNGSGSSKYDQPTDTTQAQITDGIASISNGFNATNGVDNKIVSVNKTINPQGGWLDD